jgi:hypothetical protein
MTTIEKISDILVNTGYVSLPIPFTISFLPFQFASAFVGNYKTLDLILVVDLFVDKDENRLVQKIQSLGKALDNAESRRSITAVLVGPPIDLQTAEAISKICRVLAIGNPPDDDSLDQYLHDWLAVLLPLPKLDGVSAIADWKAELTQQAGNIANNAFFKAVVDASQQGAEAVKSSLAGRLQSEIARSLREQSK